MTEIYKKLASDGLTVTIANLTLALYGIFLLPIITKFLGPQGYGIWVQILALFPLIGILCSTGSFAYIRFFAAEKDPIKIRNGFFSLLIFILIISCIISAILFFFQEEIAKFFFGGTQYQDLVTISILIVPLFSINSLFFFFFRTFRMMKTYSIFLIFQNYLQLPLIILLIVNGWGIFGALFGYLISYFLSEIIMLFLIIREVGIGIPPLNSFLKIIEYLKFDVPYIPSNLSNWILNLSDRYLIALFLGVTSTGIYAASYNLGSMLSQIIYPLNIILVPTLAHLYDNNNLIDVKKILKNSLKYYLIFAIPAAVGLSILAKPILEILTTPEFAQAAPYIVPLVSLGVLLNGCRGIISQPLNLIKKTKMIGVSFIVAAAINIVLNIFLIPLWGIIGAAFSTFFSFLICLILTAYVSFKYISFKIDWKSIIKNIIASLLMAVLIFIINPVTIIPIMVTIVIGGLFYFIVLLILKGITHKDIKLILSVIRG